MPEAPEPVDAPAPVVGPTPSRPAVDRRPDLNVAALWVASRVSVFIAATYSTWILAGDPQTMFRSPADEIPALGPIATWNRWDLEWYASIATDGYGAAGHESNYASPPGFPGLLWALGKLNIHVTLAGLLISFVAGLLAAMALSRLTRSLGGRGELGVLAWVLAPVAVFLAAPYAEALFCAFAFCAWVLARRQAWLSASLLTAAACLVRVNGLFLACALVVLFLTGRPRAWRQAPLLLLPFATVLGLLVYFWTRTGSWLTWFEAQGTGWDRRLLNPWDTLTSTVNYAYNIGLAATYNVQYRFELAFMLVLVVLTVVMLVKRWWGEATYMLLTIVALGTSTLYYSVPRASLTLFPVWMLIGLWMSRSRTVLASYVAVSTPLMLMGVMAFVNGRWVA